MSLKEWFGKNKKETGWTLALLKQKAKIPNFKEWFGKGRKSAKGKYQAYKDKLIQNA